MQNQTQREVVMIIPMCPNMELAAAQTAYTLAEIMNFDENNIDEIQIAIIETCINAFEHSNSKERRVWIKFIMTDDELILKITDRGVGLRVDKVKSVDRKRAANKGLRKRGWGMEIIRTMMDEVNIESSDQGTTITMIKKKTSSK